MKIVTIVGARPQFIKAAVVSRIIRREHEEVLIHTGQHYDANMSDIFFNELNIPLPEYNLGINGGSHGRMTGEMLIKIEELLTIEKPDMLLVYGDTNSTVAGALAAVKLRIPICHVEAGNRLGTLNNPEEVNRILTDHISSLLLCSTESSVSMLRKENIVNNVFFTGDPMYDAFLYYSECCSNKELVAIKDKIIDIPGEYYYLTCHREENTNSDATLREILAAMEELDTNVIYPVHPRNREQVIKLVDLCGFKNTVLIEPVGYLTSINLVKNAKKVITDSGGLQREAFFAGIQCVTIFDYVGWPETMVGNRNQLSKAQKEDILQKISNESTIDHNYKPFGDGNSALKILKYINTFGKKGLS